MPRSPLSRVPAKRLRAPSVGVGSSQCARFWCTVHVRQRYRVVEEFSISTSHHVGSRKASNGPNNGSAPPNNVSGLVPLLTIELLLHPSPSDPGLVITRSSSTAVVSSASWWSSSGSGPWWKSARGEPINPNDLFGSRLLSASPRVGPNRCAITLRSRNSRRLGGAIPP